MGLGTDGYRGLIEDSPDLYWTMDLNGRWTYLNAAALKIYGVAPGELVGRPFVELSEQPEKDGVHLESVFSGSRLEGYETDHRSVGGEPRRLRLSAAPLRNHAGTVTGARGVAHDITAQVQTLRELGDARSEAERLAEAKGAFLANMSHELRTPMNGVLGMVELLLQSSLDAEQRSAAELIRTSAGSLLSVINDVLDFSKIEAGGLTLESSVFDVYSLVDSVVTMAGATVTRPGLEMSTDFGGDVPRLVRGDPGRLRQALTNLVGNAVKFTAHGRVEVDVRLEDRNESSARLVFMIRDTGIGIPADRLETVFEEYAQSETAASRRSGGTGLGLAIVRRLAALMHGEVRVSSELGRGSLFELIVEMGVAHVSDADVTRLLVRLDGMEALVVGAEEARAAVTTVLRSAGVRTHEVVDGQAALVALRSGRHPYAVVVIDSFVASPGGFELARMIRERPELRGLKLVMLTSAGQRGDAMLCREIGVSAYLTKPLSRPELLEAMAAVLAEDEASGAGSLITKHSIEEARRRLRVLLAEDNAVNQAVAATMLRRRGHHVDVAETGPEAVAAWRSGDYHVVLMDLQMPGLNGFEVLEEIRRSPKGGAVPVVAMTARVGEGNRERCLSSGFNAFVAKPFQPHELFAAVEGGGIADTEMPSVHAASIERHPVHISSLTETMSEAGVAESVSVLLAVFRQDAPMRLKNLEDSVQARSAAAVEAAAHVFKSAAATIMASGLESALEALESAGRRDGLSDVEALFEQARREHDLVIAFLDGLGVQQAAEAA